MGNLPNCCCGKNYNNNGNDVGGGKIQTKTSVNLLQYNPNFVTTEDINRIDNRNKNNDKSIDDSSISYDYFTPEEMLEINEKINNKFQKYQKIPLKSSDINIIYKSGLIE